MAKAKARTIFDKIAIPVFTPWSKGNNVDWQPANGVGLGVGRGEDRIVWELGKLGRLAHTVGGSEQYDIIEASGMKWEVKEPDGSLSIRPGVAGRAATAELTKKIKEIVSTLLHALTLVTDPDAKIILNSEMMNGFELDVDGMRDFLAKAVLNIEKGEISNGLFFGGTNANKFGLMSIVTQISRFIAGRRNNIVSSVRFMEHPRTLRLIEMHEKEHYDDIVRRLISDDMTADLDETLSKLDTLEKLGATQVDYFAARLRDEHILNFLIEPQRLLQLWENSASPSKTFDCVDGIIIVSKDEGYAIIPRNLIDKYLTFSRITQHNSRFKLVRKNDD